MHKIMEAYRINCYKVIAVTPDAGKNVKQQSLPFIGGGNAKYYHNFGRQFSSSYKTKHTLFIQQLCSLVFT
jgi:hypothetical protein